MFKYGENCIVIDYTGEERKPKNLQELIDDMTNSISIDVDWVSPISSIGNFHCGVSVHERKYNKFILLIDWDVEELQKRKMEMILFDDKVMDDERLASVA